MSEDEFDYEQTGSQEEDNITANDDADDELSFSEALENYLPTAENTNKVKKHFPVWFTSLITAFATCFVILMAYTFIIFPHIRPSAVISYTQNAENGDLGEAATDIGAIVQKTAPSIVKVSGKSDYRSFFGFSTQTNSGSGIIIAENGYILTANSLVGSNGEASVIIGKDTYTAKLVGQDISKDIAIIKIDLSGLAPVTLSDSDGARTGDTVIAMANILDGARRID